MFLFCYVEWGGVRGSVVGWSALPQAGMLWVPVPKADNITAICEPIV
jgi:hypothetical protein